MGVGSWDLVEVEILTTLYLNLRYLMIFDDKELTGISGWHTHFTFSPMKFWVDFSQNWTAWMFPVTSINDWWLFELLYQQVLDWNILEAYQLFLLPLLWTEPMIWKVWTKGNGLVWTFIIRLAYFLESSLIVDDLSQSGFIWHLAELLCRVES